MIPPFVGSIVQTATLGSPDGQAFNDLAALRESHGLPVDFVVNPSNPIAKIVVSHGWIIDRLEITYNLARGGTQTLTHGGPHGTGSEFKIGSEEVISSVSGLIGPHKDYDNKVLLSQITFSILNVTTGVTTVRSFGGRPQGQPFVVTLPAMFAGRVTNADSNTIGFSAFGVIKRGEF